MKLSEVKALLNEKISPVDFKTIIQNELSVYQRGALERGRSMPIVLDEDIELLISKDFLLRLCKAYVVEDLSELEINYVADALLLSQNVVFSSDKIKEILESLTDPEVSGKLSKSVVKKFIERLNYE